MDSDSRFQYELKQYKNAIRSKMPFSNAVTKKLLADLQYGIDDYISMNNVTSFDEIVEQFGLPEDVANELKNNADTQVIKRKISIKKAVVASIAVVVLLVGIGIAKIANDADTANATYSNDLLEDVSIDDTVNLNDVLVED